MGNILPKSGTFNSIYARWVPESMWLKMTETLLRQQGCFDRLALHARQLIAYPERLSARPADVEMILKHRLYVLIRRIKAVAIDGRVVVAVLSGKAMRKIAAAAGIHELALTTLPAKVD